MRSPASAFGSVERFGAAGSARREPPAAAGEPNGFTLTEVLVAIGILVTIAIGVAQLAAMATGATRASREHTAAVILAAAKMDQLRALAWTYEPEVPETAAVERSDLTTNLSEPEHRDDGLGLSASPPDVLSRSTPPFVDYLDEGGRWVGNDRLPPPEAVFVRRWAVRPLPADPQRTLILQVLVTSARVDRTRSRPWQQRGGTDALLVSIRTRKAQ